MKLNLEQRKIIEMEPSGHSLVKGVAGSGKTTVAIHRLFFLKQHYCPEENDKVLLVTFNKTLLHFIEHQYTTLQAEENEFDAAFGNKDAIHINNIDKLMFSFFSQYKKRKNLKVEIIDNDRRRKLLQQALFSIKDTYSSIKMMKPTYINFLLDEIDWINACHIQTRQTYQEIDRTGRANGGNGNPQKLNKNSEVRDAIYDLKETYERLLKKNQAIDFKMMNEMALEEAQHQDHPTYTHILIDESQDLSKVQLKFIQLLHSRSSYSSIMFVADNTQSIYPQSWLGKGRSYTTLGYDMSGRSRTLSKNYRTTTEISKAAYSLIEHDETIKNNIDFVKPSLIDRHGHEPIYRYFLDSQKQATFLVEEITSLKQDYALSDICIVAKEKRLIESASDILDNAGISNDLLQNSHPNFKKESVKLVTMHSIKGLEFKVIFLIDLNEGIIPHTGQGYDIDDTMDSEERKLLYVGMTRASELLYMSSVRQPSRFIKELDNQSLRLLKDAKIHPFRSLSIQDYVLTDSIIDLNAKEEVIRQWLLKELQHTYGYPLELMHLEYPVHQFSRKGYVDVAITIHRNGETIPYLFAEVKAFGTDLSDAKAQLQSYMQANNDALYGVVTNGIDIVITDKQGDSVSDIPPCQPHYLPATKSSQTYLDLRHDKSYGYLVDKDDTEAIEIFDTDAQLTLSDSPDQRIPLIGNVAAGLPIQALESYEDTIAVMDSWVIKPSETFALRVTGDSMIDAGINKGDMIVVHKQNHADNGDIIVALIGEEATVKKFMRMGSSVLLISENTTYEPIQMNAEDVVINGKVIGVLKT